MIPLISAYLLVRKCFFWVLFSRVKETIFHNPKQEEGVEGLESEGLPRPGEVVVRVIHMMLYRYYRIL